MCGIYGVLSYKDKLKDINSLVYELGVQSMERGTDATGIAYVQSGTIKINKRAVSALSFKPNMPKFTKAAIGHTRHATQGDKSKNYNNHPWRETVRNCQFALAHNGIIWNDDELQRKYHFKSKVQTDSFVAVQLLKMRNRLDFDSLKFMAESIDGSYSFNLLDNHNNIYLVKGDSPISIIHFRKLGIYVFASTSHILWRTLVNSELFPELRNGEFEEIVMREGDILKIGCDGRRENAEFAYTETTFGMRWYDFGRADYSDAEKEYLGEIKHIAAMYGMDPEEIQELYEAGYTLDELEDIIYSGAEI